MAPKNKRPALCEHHRKEDENRTYDQGQRTGVTSLKLSEHRANTNKQTTTTAASLWAVLVNFAE